MLRLAGLALLATPLSAQTADEIIAKYVKTVGGMDKIQAVTTLRRTGKFTGGGGFEAAVLQENKRPTKVREEFSLQGMTGINAYDGKTGWKIEPWQGKKDPEALSEEEMKQIVEDADFDEPLVNYQQKGNKVELVGTDQVEGTDAYKLKVTLASGDVRYYYVDTDYYVPIKIEMKRMIRGAEQEFETSLGDYKEVAGWYLPYAMESNVRGSDNKQKVTFEKIEANVALDDQRFEKPAPGAKPPEPAPAKPPETKKVQAKKPSLTEGTFFLRATQQAAPVKVDSETISGLGARNIGSAAMSGRVAALDAVHEGERLTVYISAASGGVWKSVNGGTTFKPVFDKQPVQSIGAITVDPKNPKVVWVGTGEAWTRNSVSIGDGVYKSVDGGDNWTNLGLKESERIAKIVVDPSETNTVYVCVPGKLWSDSDERGVYKTTDGGKTWVKVLKGSNLSTGCSMLSLDPQNPKTIFAGMWDFRRKGWTFRSGGDGPTAPSGSGLFKSSDGGASWTELSSAKGLPSKPWGRVAVAVAPSKPNVVYAFIEAQVPTNGLYRSDDGGQTWEARDRSQAMIWRPFYFANLIVDPKNENRIYKPDGPLIVSTDGGRSFSNISGGAHGDFHDAWIDPRNTDHLITGDDGGVWYSYDAANKWWKADNLPISQFYHVSVDMDRPYHVYGGLQDNSSWVGESEYPGGVTSSRWENMYGGDGFWMFVDPTDPDYIYAEYQGGEIARVNRKTHETRNIRPLPQYKEGKLRFNWNTPIHVSPTKSGTIYLGAQVLFRSRDGQTWERVSPDLTTNDPEKQKQEQSGGVTVDNSSAEMHTTIFAISESPKNPDVVWAGTDDGNVQVTRDGGKTWTNVVANIRGLPKNAWVSSLEAGHFDEGTVYATFDIHTFGDMRPYAYSSTDFGKTWSPLVAPDSPVRGYAHVVKEDLVDKQLLFLGTEFGLWVSIDGGAHWAHYKGGDLPSVAVRDLAIHPRDHDLVIATHGRGIWIVDDITPLRALTPEALASNVAFLPARSTVQRVSASGGWANGDAAFVGPNPPGDAVISYYQKKRHIFGDLKIEVFDQGGRLMGTVPSSKRRGLNRVTWSMRLKPPKVPSAASAAFGAAFGPRVLPGTYTVKMTKDKEVYSTPLVIVADARTKHTAADRQAQFDLAMKLTGVLADMTFAVERMNGVRLALDERAAKLPAKDALAPRLRAASATADSLRKKIVATKEGGMITGEERLRENLTDLYGNVVFYDGRPSQTQVERTEAIARELADVIKDFDAWAAKQLDGLNSALARKRLEPIRLLTRQQWEAKDVAAQE
ncbi:MAG: sialidase [Gemmatimonadetes bacterium 13_1_40CM_69_22]|nr:MAG: sialidase [Gemmatimonadetes bacterium 13_1_40CM_69_22]